MNIYNRFGHWACSGSEEVENVYDIQRVNIFPSEKLPSLWLGLDNKKFTTFI
jgi:hypothetical protein